MTLLGRLAFLFVVIPVIELVLLVRIGELVGLWPTLALVLLTGAAGAALARAEGMRVLYRFQQELAEGRIPGQPLLDGIAVLIGGAFLVTPGILTDLTGLLLLLPPSRHWIQRRVRARLERSVREGSVDFVVLGAGPGRRSGAPHASGSEDLDPALGIEIDPE